MKALVHYKKSGQPRTSLEEFVFHKIEMRLQKVDLYKLGIEICCAAGEMETALDLYGKIVEMYTDEKHVPAKKQKREIVEKLKHIEKFMAEPIRIRPLGPLGPQRPEPNDLFSTPKRKGPKPPPHPD